MIMKLKKLFIWLLAFMITFAFVFSENSSQVAAADLNTTEEEFVYDEDGNKLYLETVITEHNQTAIVTNEMGEEVVNFSLNTQENSAYLNGEKLTDEEFSDVKALEFSPPTQTIDLYEPYGVRYSYAGTHRGSLWLARAGVVAAAGAIAAIVPGIGWKAAWGAAGGVIGTTNTVYYKMHIYYGYSKDYVHVKRVITFYKNSARTQVLYGPVTAYQKKGNRY